MSTGSITLPIIGGGGSSGGTITVTMTDVATTGTINALTAATSFIRLTGGSAITINGMVADGTARIITLYALSANVTINNQNGSATAANRFILTGANPYTIYTGNSATFIYDTTALRWVLYTYQKNPIQGSANQVIVSTTSNGLTTLSLPQDINFFSYPVFAGISSDIGPVVIDITNNQIFQDNGSLSIDYAQRVLFDNLNIISVDWRNRTLNNQSNAACLDWNQIDGNTLSLNNAFYTTGGNGGSLNNVPGSGNPNPTGYLQMTINGTTGYFPFWT